MSSAAYLDIHALQTLPYSNVNRDDLGAPKTLVLGGKERTRVSSQSWKRVVRHQVEERLADPTYRTRRLIAAVAECLGEKHEWSEELALQGGVEVVRAMGSKGVKIEPPKKNSDGKPDLTIPRDTSVLFFVPPSAVEALAHLASEHPDEITAQLNAKKPSSKGVLPTAEIEEILATRNASVRLFGRMMAELPSSHVDGAVQFAHAFTVHSTNIDVDFFTAVDDLLGEGETGSGHMNEGMFAAGTFYRYANINLSQLAANSDGDIGTVKQLAGEFLRAFIDTVPSGKQNATGATTVPELVHIAVRGDRPVSFAGAFEQTVEGHRGHMADAQGVLSSYAADLAKVWWPDTVLFSGHSRFGEAMELSGLGQEVDGYPQLIQAALGAITDGGPRGASR
ncbi:type I-E CRISPR-associated protein Cas7/Cse4/CasC [Spiractinospora alimapuensis]|uniref:type I-E CRISPR-associated protein Cas7/Cse4/CasC n=1 Tax=Spiractinospora alimapuensis TaxID=2820884 RepID=UPI001F2DD8C7|nr:type I-E CRISPR-associated protein Cas7/Cse4/CasC [Spiractinospora alimapuensis]QVQ51554.1 type I-E CRISPR-associated protein Cas7/Cse4/CasC [Spiractinospora alimapuensis]